ncbi:MAG TPA: 50S ribosomal protein L4 [Polyangia bacterium]|nr:50S ribosomal protein L4 [Polyangia bacterium]
MPKLKVRNVENKEVGEIDLSDAVFGSEVRLHLLHEIVRMQRCRKRSGTAAVKERSAVAGGGAKPFRQKGTGRARQGTSRSPLHPGGGAVHGPRPRSYDFQPPKTVRRGAMISALSLFTKEDRLVVLDSLELAEIKTSRLNSILDTLGTGHALLVDVGENDTLRMSARNLARHQFLPPEGLNVYDLLRHDQLVITKRAVLEVQGRLERPLRARRAEA